MGHGSDAGQMCLLLPWRPGLEPLPRLWEQGCWMWACPPPWPGRAHTGHTACSRGGGRAGRTPAQGVFSESGQCSLPAAPVPKVSAKESPQGSTSVMGFCSSFLWACCAARIGPASPVHAAPALVPALGSRVLFREPPPNPGRTLLWLHPCSAPSVCRRVYFYLSVCCRRASLTPLPPEGPRHNPRRRTMIPLRTETLWSALCVHAHILSLTLTIPSEREHLCCVGLPPRPSPTQSDA